MTIQRTFLVTLLLLFITLVIPQAQAFNPPSQDTMTNGPLYYPCKVNKVPSHTAQQGYISCSWMGERILKLYDDRTQQWYQTFNQTQFTCSMRGVCVGTGLDQGLEVGGYPLGHAGIISIWYYLDQSSEGQPMAYRYDQGPRSGHNPVAYIDAARHLVDYYETYGGNDEFIERKLNDLYETGFEGYIGDVVAVMQGGEQSGDIGKVEEASCSAQLDDNCYVNGQKVPMADLPKYLPLVDPDTVVSNGGACDYPICYDGNNRPIGLRASMY